MPLFLSDNEQARLLGTQHEPIKGFYWALINRAEKRAMNPGLTNIGHNEGWWYAVAEFLSDAAMTHQLKPSSALTAWLRSTTLEIIRRPIEDWIGPPFRNRENKSGLHLGHPETAHLSWSVAVVLDLAVDIFSNDEQDEIRSTLFEKGITLCQRRLAEKELMDHQRCVLNTGITIPALVLGNHDLIPQSIEEYHRCLNLFQPDGSYGESLQYGNYAAYNLILVREALLRHNPNIESKLPLHPYVRKIHWDIQSLFYKKSLSDWGTCPWPRSANFNDSAAIYRPSADFLLHIAHRAKHAHPKEAGLARWLFDTLYLPCVEYGFHDRATFGFINDFGFLTLPLLLDAIDPITPKEAEVPLLAGFSCGDVLVRDGREHEDGRTVLAIHGAGDSLHALSNPHGDLNSFILVHNNERLLIDPGHSSHQSLLYPIDQSTQTHNTCTFHIAGKTIQQSSHHYRRYDLQTGEANPPVNRGGQRLLLAREGPLTAVASEIAGLYGNPIETFIRFWFLCGEQTLFVVDQIIATEPIQTTWNWIFNNRDHQLDLKLFRPDRLVVRRGNAGMKLFHLAENPIHGPTYARMHDAYHPLPNQLGEGHPGSALRIHWTEQSPRTSRTVIHAMSMDTPGLISGWHLRKNDQSIALESPGSTQYWQLSGSPESGTFIITDQKVHQEYTISNASGKWQLTS